MKAQVLQETDTRKKINSKNSPQSSLMYTLWGNPVKTAHTIEQ